MEKCVRPTGREVNCLFPQWVTRGVCSPPPGKICPKFSLGNLHDPRTGSERAVDQEFADHVADMRDVEGWKRRHL